MSKSVNRVQEAAKSLGLDVEVVRMPDSTRTAADAAKACGCEVGQIVKSMIFEGVESGDLKLLLVSGAHDVDLTTISDHVGEGLTRADPKRVREETGFAIGGVSPIGHLAPIATWMDDTLLSYQEVWAAAGAPNAVFRVAPDDLKAKIGAKALPLNSA
ncbi:YbaK/EbsC family protein [Marivivens donghaensis]|uniref:YbaK/EbsC family protein n=1 Tax=Marivivens donghaensis TaxID=1699413 RepID=A0ABX0VZA8_9RHOB|nr:YbaK/EbsC family protein [Marivivens donghaensis]NIY73433.1 YbaK/EbsC family protein [Marivivens donghaensis]